MGRRPTKRTKDAPKRIIKAKKVMDAKGKRENRIIIVLPKKNTHD